MILLYNYAKTKQIIYKSFNSIEVLYIAWTSVYTDESSRMYLVWHSSSATHETKYSKASETPRSSVAEFAMRSDERKLRSKFFLLFNMDKRTLDSKI